jgi:hypothetical protein
MPTEKDGVALDSMQLLGFGDIAKVAGGGETPTVEELSRVLSKSGQEAQVDPCQPAQLD